MCIISAPKEIHLKCIWTKCFQVDILNSPIVGHTDYVPSNTAMGIFYVLSLKMMFRKMTKNFFRIKC